MVFYSIFMVFKSSCVIKMKLSSECPQVCFQQFLVSCIFCRFGQQNTTFILFTVVHIHCLSTKKNFKCHFPQYYRIMWEHPRIVMIIVFNSFHCIIHDGHKQLGKIHQFCSCHIHTNYARVSILTILKWTRFLSLHFVH